MSTIIALFIIHLVIGEILFTKYNANSKAYGIVRKYTFMERVLWPIVWIKNKRILWGAKELEKYMVTITDPIVGFKRWHSVFVINAAHEFGNVTPDGKNGFLFLFNSKEQTLQHFTYGSDGETIPTYFKIDDVEFPKEEWLRHLESKGDTGKLISRYVRSFDNYQPIAKTLVA